MRPLHDRLFLWSGRLLCIQPGAHSTYAPINLMPHSPPCGHRLGKGGDSPLMGNEVPIPGAYLRRWIPHQSPWCTIGDLLEIDHKARAPTWHGSQGKLRKCQVMGCRGGSVVASEYFGTKEVWFKSHVHPAPHLIWDKVLLLGHTMCMFVIALCCVFRGLNTGKIRWARTLGSWLKWHPPGRIHLENQ